MPAMLQRAASLVNAKVISVAFSKHYNACIGPLFSSACLIKPLRKEAGLKPLTQTRLCTTVTAFRGKAVRWDHGVYHSCCPRLSQHLRTKTRKGKKKRVRMVNASLSPERAVNTATTCLVRFLQPSTGKRGASTSVSLSLFSYSKEKKRCSTAQHEPRAGRGRQRRKRKKR